MQCSACADMVYVGEMGTYGYQVMGRWMVHAGLINFRADLVDGEYIGVRGYRWSSVFRISGRSRVGNGKLRG